MSGLYNINKHIREIIKPELALNGFKNKGNHFFKYHNNFKEELYIYSSLYNAGFMPTKQYFIDIYLIKDDFYHFHERLPNKPVTEKPDKYDEYYNIKLFNGDYRKRDSSFSIEETTKIWKYTLLYDWYYHDENELLILLEKTKNIINTYALKFFLEIEEIIDKPQFDRKELVEKFNEIFYWKPIITIKFGEIVS